MMRKVLLMEGKINSTDTHRTWLDEYPGAVFTGQVTKIEKVSVKLSGGDDLQKYKVTFAVDRYWKGTDNSQTIVFTGVGGGSCGIRFRKGESYIVFAQMIDDRLQTGICSFTAEGRFAENMIKGLNMGDGRRPTLETGNTDNTDFNPDLDPFYLRLGREVNREHTLPKIACACSPGPDRALCRVFLPQ